MKWSSNFLIDFGGRGEDGMKNFGLCFLLDLQCPMSKRWWTSEWKKKIYQTTLQISFSLCWMFFMTMIDAAQQTASSGPFSQHLSMLHWQASSQNANCTIVFTRKFRLHQTSLEMLQHEPPPFIQTHQVPSLIPHSPLAMLMCLEF